MKKILVLSDNHGNVGILKELLLQNEDCDYYVHCGDSEMTKKQLNHFIAVRGNCDYDFELDDEFILELENHKILITHGHKKISFQRNVLDLIEYAKTKACDIVFFGHTHIFLDQVIKNIHLVNPGSLHHSRDGSLCSYALVYIEKDNVIVERKNIR